MPNVELSAALDERIKSHARPLVDTYESVISRAFDAFELTLGSGANAIRPFNPAKAPSLTFSKPISITLNEVEFAKADLYWNNLMYAVVREAGKKGLNPEQIKELMVVNSEMGEKSINGYAFIPEAGLSIQGQSANGAWKQTYAIANELGFALDVIWAWDDTEKASLPSQKGSFKLPA